MPLYATLILFFGGTVLGHLPPALKWYYTALVTITTAVIPALAIALMHSMGMISCLVLDDRRERALPLAVVLVCYVACAVMMGDALLVFLVRKIVVAGIAAIALALVVTFFWKISLHMIAAGGMVSILLLLNVSGYGQLLWALCAAILLAGALGSARLYLQKQTPAQVAAGFFGGMLVSAIAMLF
jgi:hypothetical protein